MASYLKIYSFYLTHHESFPIQRSVINRKLFWERSGDSGKQAISVGIFSQDWKEWSEEGRTLSRMNRDMEQDCKIYRVRYQEISQGPIAETGIQGRDWQIGIKKKTYRVQLLALGLVTRLPWCLDITEVGKQVRLTDATLQCWVDFGVEALGRRIC